MTKIIVPCDNPKCISYPICVDKNIIHCDRLALYFDEIYDYYLKEYPIEFYPTTNEAWKAACKIVVDKFTNLRLIKSNGLLRSFYIILNNIK